MSKSRPAPVVLAECSTPLVRRPLDVAEAAALAPLLKALADPVRLRLLSLIASYAGGEACVCDLLPAFDLAQPTVSHHLKVLHGVGLVERERRGSWVYYRARRDALAAVARVLDGGSGRR